MEKKTKNNIEQLLVVDKYYMPSKANYTMSNAEFIDIYDPDKKGIAVYDIANNGLPSQLVTETSSKSTVLIKEGWYFITTQRRK
jgi:hypothetical protein